VKFNRHSDVEGQHSFLSASKYHWINYEPERLLESVANSRAAALGTRKHNAARECIELGMKLQNTGQTINMYVNDCIGYRMSPEVTLFHSYNAFGTADAISFRREGEEMVLRIFDLKTGVSATSGMQLKVYAAYFCLEYNVRPMEIAYDLRIYQNDEIKMIETDPEEIVYIMDRIVESDKLIIKAMQEEVI
jgi:hypothetical protein